MARSGSVAPSYPKIMLFGDSLTQWSLNADRGWVQQLERRFLRRADVLNRGFAGWNSKWLAEYIPGLLENEVRLLSASEENPKKPPLLFATLLIGCNDSGLANTSRHRYHVPLASFEENVRNSVLEILRYTDTVILMATTPISEVAWNEQMRSWARDGILGEDAQQAVASDDARGTKNWLPEKAWDELETKKYSAAVMEV